MNELLDFAIVPSNIVVTSLLIFCLVYWGIVMLGFVDLDFIDIDADAEGGFSVSWINGVLSYFNLGQIPLMIFMTFFGLPLWIITILTNYYLGITTLPLGMIVIAIGSVISLFISKIMTNPFVKLFSKMAAEGETQVSLIGKIGTVVLNVDGRSIGQVEVKTHGSSYLLNSKTKPDTLISKGEQCLVIEYLEKDKCYYVEPYQSI